MSHAVVNPDREELIQCPYDPVHMISQMRFPYHLIKCRKNHNGREYAQCPFDAKHVILKTRFQDHLETCNKRAIIEPQLVMDDTRNLELLIPESQADKIQAGLTNEWDLEMPSVASTNGFVTQTTYNTFQALGNGRGMEKSEVNSFSAGNSFNGQRQVNGHVQQSGSSQWNGGASYNNGNQAGGSFSKVRYDYYQDKPEYSNEVVPRKPNLIGKGKTSSRSISPDTQNSASSQDNFDVAGASAVPPRKPHSFSSKVKSASINAPDPLKPSQAKPFGRGRGTNRGVSEDVHVVNKEAGPGSYVMESLQSEQFERYSPPVSFGRGRGGTSYADRPTMRRPGMNEAETRASLEKDKNKLLKKIRETKQLEERLANGEILEDNQVSKVAKLASMQNELNKISKQLENL